MGLDKGKGKEVSWGTGLTGARRGRGTGRDVWKERPPARGAFGEGERGKARIGGPQVRVNPPPARGGGLKGYVSPASAGDNEYRGEFDPGSERTLAARLKHASRAARCGNAP